ncbi:general substrate transporter [Microdochium trichocladiopsis]|uniref:General substrate transporter n=1 Tax=Microdochium trichocladiopsis TaxID=1682393 RepID=A0A9P8XRX2_9PEZI|nr:general substrate transporter [Microdochium trichocladiopsis]KAH7014095.1 general substrate transporter [Microdochium trichocladiopsis]
MNWLIITIALVSAQGGFIYGLDTGIIATTFGHDSFRIKMYGGPFINPVLSGAIVSCYNAGQAVGGMSTGFLADKFSRKYTILIACILTIIGSVLQCAATGVGMMIAGRAVAGIGCGQLLPVVPTYLAETAPPSRRGFLVGLQGMMIAIGFGVANWIGYAGAFAQGDAQWRIPLAMQLPLPLMLSVLVFWLPFSPRWLVMQGRHEEAKAVLLKLHHDKDNVAASDDLVEQEIVQVREQIALEREIMGGLNWFAALRLMFSRQYIRRVFTATLIISWSQLSGSAVIQNFQTIFYGIIGFTGRSALLISGIYGMMGIIGQIIYLWVVADKWPRARTLWSGSAVLCSLLVICMALSAVYGKPGSSQDGARAAVASIFIYSASFAIWFNALVWVVPTEILPLFMRSKGLAFAMTFKAVFSIILSQITPIALTSIGWKFYAVFVAINLAGGLFFFFCLPETGGKSLEEIAELFGDGLATEHLGESAISGEASAEQHEIALSGEEKRIPSKV